MKPSPYCSTPHMCMSACRTCKETEAVNHAAVQQEIEDRERAYDEAFPPDDLAEDGEDTNVEDSYGR
jgi:hypothetical protein